MNTSENNKLSTLFTRVTKAEASIVTAQEKHQTALNKLHEYATENDCLTFEHEGQCFQIRSKKGNAYICEYKVPPAEARKLRAARKQREAAEAQAEAFIAHLPDSISEEDREAARVNYLASLELPEVPKVDLEDSEEEVEAEPAPKSRARKTGTDDVAADETDIEVE